jgi:N-acetylmuramoyl-L-alanine amidase
MMKRLLLISLSVVVATAGVARAAPSGADDAYQAAKDAYQKLKHDQQRRKFRHHWQNSAKRFEAVAARYPKSDRAPEAIFLAAELTNELSRFSQNGDDVEAAERGYRRLLQGWPKHALADDAALSLARLLADRGGGPLAARSVLEEAVGAAKDKKKEMAAMLAALPTRAATKEPKKQKAAPALAPAKSGPKGETVLQAINRAVGPLAGLQVRLPADEVPVQARRVPPVRARDDEALPREAAAGDDADEASPIVALQEKLRDVRVGARPEDATVRSQFKQLARAEAGSELSLAQQLGLKVRRIVVDPGHGGHDTGAIGAGGTREKDVALAISLKLVAKLEALGLEVVLTRPDDSYVKLEDRATIANQQRGDLFISVHCNAAPSKALRGIETYTLNTSSNRYSIRLAARENATTERGVGDLQYILADLATRANTGESSRLAERVQRSLVRDLASGRWADVKDLGHKEALFFVLLGAKMPSILVETSFISNPEEERRLADEKYQQAIADSIAGSVDEFLNDRNKLAQVD